MLLNQNIKVSRRFQRAISIDKDTNDASALDGFICPESSAEVLRKMAFQIQHSGQGGFTWTGPYGSGKSSLVVVLSALLSGQPDIHQKAIEILGKKTAKKILDALPDKTVPWHIIPVVGRREAPCQVIGDALNQSSLLKKITRQWDDTKVLNALARAAEQGQKVVIFIDEMGKFLEGAAQQGGDIYLFQLLTELASRSNGHLIIVGVLHQAFEEYANQLARDMRDEWAKIQGRFVDLPVNTAGEEQIQLIGRAIESNYPPPQLIKTQATSISACIRNHAAGISKNFDEKLAECWPLHPATAALLGPISRRRFGQNQRSIFAFLNSAEPYGFQDFINNNDSDAIYSLAWLWDYLRTNLEPAIVASPDGHRWSAAAESVDRCEALPEGNDLGLQIIKSIALIDLFKERSGLLATVDVLSVCCNTTPLITKKILSQLESHSLIQYRKHQSAYAIHSGSDFDIEQTLLEVMGEEPPVDFKILNELAGLQPVLAKRHYHETGALRWFDILMAPAENLPEYIHKFKPKEGVCGLFILVIPRTHDDSLKNLCLECSTLRTDIDLLLGHGKNTQLIIQMAKELQALETIREHAPALSGDAIARREVRVRIGSLQSQIEGISSVALQQASWALNGKIIDSMGHQGLQQLTSRLASDRFSMSPIIHNELLNKAKPSASAIAGRKALLKRMVLNTSEQRLGIEGYPAEAGLYESLLSSTKLHTELKTGEYAFTKPRTNDQHNLYELWDSTTEHLKNNSERTIKLSEIYDLWQGHDFGIKQGLLPVFAVAYLLSQKNKIAFYREGIFQTQITDLDIDYLTKDPACIAFRWMEMTEVSAKLLHALSSVCKKLSPDTTLKDAEPIDVARALIRIFDQLPTWTKRTTQLSRNAQRIRKLFKHANDPNGFLFDDIPAMFDQPLNDKTDLETIVTPIEEGLSELQQAYPDMLNRFRTTIFAELGVPNDSAQSLHDLRARATNIKDVAGEFRLEAFVTRLAVFEDSLLTDTEQLASLSINKIPKNWVDADISRAMVALAELSRRFVQIESFAHVKGRKDKRQQISLVVSQNGQNTPSLMTFDVNEHDEPAITKLEEKLQAMIGKSNTAPNIVLAALARLCKAQMPFEAQTPLSFEDTSDA